MAFKQPHVPVYREQEGAGRCLQSIVLFLKDFCMDAWQTARLQEKRMDALERRIRALEADTEKGNMAWPLT